VSGIIVVTSEIRELDLHRHPLSHTFYHSLSAINILFGRNSWWTGATDGSLIGWKWSGKLV